MRRNRTHMHHSNQSFLVLDAQQQHVLSFLLCAKSEDRLLSDGVEMARQNSHSVEDVKLIQ
jgi:hypothetical protein